MFTWWSTGDLTDFDNYNSIGEGKTGELPFSPLTLECCNTGYLEKILPEATGVLYLSVMVNMSRVGSIWSYNGIFELFDDEKGDMVAVLYTKTREGKSYIGINGKDYYIDYPLYGTQVWKQVEMEYNKESQKINVWINGTNYLSISVEITKNIKRVRQGTQGTYTSFVYTNAGRVGNKTPMRIQAVEKGTKSEMEVFRYIGLLDTHGRPGRSNSKFLMTTFNKIESDGILNSLVLGVDTGGKFNLVLLDEDDNGIMSVRYVSESIEIKETGFIEISEGFKKLELKKGQRVGIYADAINLMIANNSDFYSNKCLTKYVFLEKVPQINETYESSSMKQDQTLFGISYTPNDKSEFYKVMQMGVGLDEARKSYIKFSKNGQSCSVILDKVKSPEVTAIRGIKFSCNGQMGDGINSLEFSIDNEKKCAGLPTISAPVNIVLMKDYLLKDFVNKEVTITAR